MRRFARVAMALAAVALFAPAIVHAQAKPVIAVVYFDNNSFGKDRTDFEGLGKGVADMLITDMASNPSVKLVERDRIQAILTEQNLVKSGAIDAQTAIRIGKLVNAQYMVTGAFMATPSGRLILTARIINNETGAIMNPVRMESTNDVLGLVSQVSTRLNADIMKLPALRVGENTAPSGETPAGQPASQQAQAAAPAAPAAMKVG